MASSSKTRDDIYAELTSPLERFSWSQDELVTQRRRRRAKASRMFLAAGIVAATVCAGALYQARIVGFGPLASAASVSSK